MALKDWFSKEGKDTRAVAKWGKKLMGKWQQTGERKRAIEALTEIGTEDAVVALLKRYQYRTDATITDEEEKEMVYQCVVSLGPKAVPGLIQFITNETAIYWPVKAMRAIVGDEEAGTHILTAFEQVPDSFGVNKERRQQLVANMREFVNVDDRVYRKLFELLEDEDEDVVIRAVDGLCTRGEAKEVTNRVVPILFDPNTSIRLRTLITELMIEQEWNVKVFRKKLAGNIPEAYFIDATGVVRRK